MKETNQFYGTAAWKAARQAALDRDMGLCVWCRARGRTARDRLGRRVPVLATMVHHVQHLEDRPDLALDLGNLVSLCDRCHDEAHPEKHVRISDAEPMEPNGGGNGNADQYRRNGKATFAEKLGIKVERL